MTFGLELLARQHMQERLREADDHRLARAAAPAAVPARPWRARLALAVVRRLARVAQVP